MSMHDAYEHVTEVDMRTGSFITVTELTALARTLLQFDDISHQIAAKSKTAHSVAGIDALAGQAEQARQLYLMLTRMAMNLVGKQVPQPLYVDAVPGTEASALDENLAHMVSALIGIDAYSESAVVEISNVLALIQQAEHTLQTMQRRVATTAMTIFAPFSEIAQSQRFPAVLSSC